jgi:hypothetical protein
MQPANLISSLQARLQTAKPLIVIENSSATTNKAENRTENTAPAPAAKFEAGQQVQATIQEQISPGLFKVQIAGQSMQMQLPGSLKAGNVITLKVESATPRLTFSIVASSAPIATAEQISSTSRLLSNLVNLPPGRTTIESTSGHAIWQATDTPPDSKQLAAGLHETLVNSGLFYESHQAQWVNGERSTAQLLIEPQNQLGKHADNQTSDTKATADIKAPAEINETADIKTTESGLPRELVPLVQQQLHALETHQLTWSGQIWPGQLMQWEIQGQPEHQSQRPDERQWSTEMELALPKLGDVHAKLVFSRGGIKLTLRGSDASSIALFNRQLPGLAATLADAGVPLSSAVIE